MHLGIWKGIEERVERCGTLKLKQNRRVGESTLPFNSPFMKLVPSVHFRSDNEAKPSFVVTRYNDNEVCKIIIKY